MNFSVLPPHKVAEIETAPVKPRPFGKRRRVNSLNCYVPAGDGQASRRVTGVHLDPDGEDMAGSLTLFAGSLLDAIQRGGSKVRTLVGPLRASDRLLENYCRTLLKSALGKPSRAVEAPVSPCIVPYLLGGITWASVEQLCYRALEVMDFAPEPMPPTTLNKAMSVVGFGPRMQHEHVDTVISYGLDNKLELKAKGKRHAHLSQRQDFLLSLPEDKGFANYIIRNGAYEDTLRRQISSMKPEIMQEVERLLDPHGGEMSKWMLDNVVPVRQAVKPLDISYTYAVERVFNKDWDQLDLLCGGPGTGQVDAEVLMARQIIKRLAYNDRIKAEVLIGMSLLTGVSIMNWLAYAQEDLQRRGETFIELAEVERALEMLEGYPGFECIEEFERLIIDWRYPSELVGHERQRKLKWARRLQSGVNPLWSTNGLYYQIAKFGSGVAICKPPAFLAPKFKRPKAKEDDK